MTGKRLLIVNADDFGQSRDVNQGILLAYQSGIVTSASLMVRYAPVGEAIEFSRKCPGLSLGLHVDLGEWLLRDREWVPVYEVVQLNDPLAVEEEVARQFAVFRRMVGHDPTHIDSHQHVHLREPVRSIVEGHARELAVPLRGCDAHISYCGEFYGQDTNGLPLPDRVTAEALTRILKSLPEGTTELCCHPAAGTDLRTMYSTERAAELQVLCDPRIREAIAEMGIALRSFWEIRA